MNWQYFSILALVYSLLSSEGAFAARITSFFGAADNNITFAYDSMQSSPSPSKCQITISNQSGGGVQQSYILTLYTSTTSDNPATTNVNFRGSPTITATSAPTATTLTPVTLGTPTALRTMNDGDVHVYTITYPSIIINHTGIQHVECNGTLEIRDVGTTPGTLSFSGFIHTLTSTRPFMSSGKPLGITLTIRGTTPLSTNQN